MRSTIENDKELTIEAIVATVGSSEGNKTETIKERV
jgi:hypothetical protein